MTTEELKFSPTAAAMLRSNLGYFDTAIPDELADYLDSLLRYAYDDFKEMKIVLTPGKLKDDMDQMIYAAWMYRNGVTGSGKSEMLKSIIRNRQVNNALRDPEGST